MAISRSIATNPDILFANEPTGALNSATEKQVLGTLLWNSLLRDDLDSASGSLDNAYLNCHERTAKSFALKYLKNCVILMLVDQPTLLIYQN